MAIVAARWGWHRARRALGRAAVHGGLARPRTAPLPPASQRLGDDLARGQAATSVLSRRAAATQSRVAAPALAVVVWSILRVGSGVVGSTAAAWGFLRARAASILVGSMRAFVAFLAEVRQAGRSLPRLATRLRSSWPIWSQVRQAPSRAGADHADRRWSQRWPSRARMPAGLTDAARALDRAIAAALVGLVATVVGLVVGGMRLLVSATRQGAQAAGRLVTLAVIAVTRLTVATTVLVIAAMLAVALVPPAASGLAGALHVGTATTEDVDLSPLRERSRVVSADGTVLGELYGEINRRVVQLADVPKVMRHAVVAAEDRRFYQHDGFDVQGIVRAAWTNFESGSIEAGGSTISQQVAKTNFTDGARTLDRKITELRYARALEAQLTKDEILERYLNEVYFGRGAYGVSAGAQAFFGRPVAYLETHQAALLAGMIAAPGSFDPDTNPQRARHRRNQVLAGMAEQGFISQDRAELASSRPLDVVSRTRVEHRDPYVIEQVKRELLASPALGATLQKRTDALFENGLTIHTSVNWRLQQQADELITEHTGDLDPTAAMVLMDDHTGEIVVTRSGREFGEDQFDPALQGRRQPGSAFKPFVLATALEQGMSLSDPINANSPAVLEFGGTRPWRVTNYAGKSLGVVTLADALKHSSNTAFARLMLKVGQDDVEGMLARLGVDVDRALGDQRGLSPAIALGGVRNGLTLPEMASAYAALTTDGRRAPAHLVTKVTDRNGEVLLRRQPERPRAVSPEVAHRLRQALRGVVEGGTGGRAQIPGSEVVGKTGTTQQFADAWFVGQTSGLVGAVWVGHPENRISMPGMTGGSVPAELWRELMTSALDRAQAPPS
jgi:penicillin-binding protein 1A